MLIAIADTYGMHTRCVCLCVFVCMYLCGSFLVMCLTHFVCLCVFVCVCTCVVDFCVSLT